MCVGRHVLSICVEKFGYGELWWTTYTQTSALLERERERDFHAKLKYRKKNKVKNTYTYIYIYDSMIPMGKCMNVYVVW